MTERLMELKTVQAGPFKTLVEAIKEILTDANFEFTPEGMRLVTLDPVTKTILVHLKLQDFEYYKCDKKIVVGVNFPNFYKLIKTMTSNDILTLYIDSDNPSMLGICIENSDNNKLTNFSLKLIEVDIETLKIDPPSFESIITFPSSEFNTICRNMSVLSETIEIKSIGSRLIFSCDGDFASQETIMGETENGLKYEQTSQENNVIQGYYNLKLMLTFSKCTNLSRTLTIYLKNNYPIVLEFDVGNLGKLKLALAPKVVV